MDIRKIALQISEQNSITGEESHEASGKTWGGLLALVMSVLAPQGARSLEHTDTYSQKDRDFLKESSKSDYSLPLDDIKALCKLVGPMSSDRDCRLQTVIHDAKYYGLNEEEAIKTYFDSLAFDLGGHWVGNEATMVIIDKKGMRKHIYQYDEGGKWKAIR